MWNTKIKIVAAGIKSQMTFLFDTAIVFNHSKQNMQMIKISKLKSIIKRK